MLFYGWVMQESEFTDLIPLMCTSAVWGQHPMFSHPEFPQRGCSLMADRWQASFLPEFPQGLPTQIGGIQSQITVTSLFTDTPFLKHAQTRGADHLNCKCPARRGREGTGAKGPLLNGTRLRGQEHSKKEGERWGDREMCWGGEEARRRRVEDRETWWGAGQVAVLNTEGTQGHGPALHTLATPGSGLLGELTASGLEGEWDRQCIPPNLNLGDMSPLEARLRPGANIHRHPMHTQAPNVHLLGRVPPRRPGSLPARGQARGRL